MTANREHLDALRADRQRLVDVLSEAKVIFKGKQCRCPFHDDQTPSAGVHELDDGTWRFTCRACDWNGGKGSGDIFDVVQRLHGCDFKGACERLCLNGSSGSNGRAKPVARTPQNVTIERNGDSAAGDTPETNSAPEAAPGRTYPTVESFTATLGNRHGGDWLYQHADGSPAMVVVRINKPTPDDPGHKEFLPLHPTPDGWKIGDPPGKLPLYRLPELAAADVVYVCEGEKAADAARSIGLTATTSAHGSGSAERTDWTPLAGKRVVILPDNDDAGRKYAAAVKAILAALNPPAATRIVELPGLPNKGDVVEFIDARECSEPDEIRREIEALSDPFAGTLIGDVWRTPRTWEPVAYVPTGLPWFDSRLCGGFRTRGVSMLCGKTGQGKTQLAVVCAVNAAKAGIPTAYFSLELGADDVSRLAAAQLGNIPRQALDRGKLNDEWGARLRDVQKRFSTLPLTILDDAQWRGGLTRETFAEMVAEGVKRFGWKMVVLDYLGLLVPSEIDRDQYDTDVRHSTELKRAARMNDVALVVVAATRKGATFRTIDEMTIDDVLGAGRLAYDAVNVLGVARHQGQENCGLIFVRPFKMRFAPCDEAAPAIQLRWRPRTGAIEHLDYDESNSEFTIGVSD